MGVGRDVVCHQIAAGDLFVVFGVCRVYREDERNACGEPQSTTQRELISQCDAEERPCVCSGHLSCVSSMCTDFSKYAFFSLSLFLGRQDTVRERSLPHSLLSPAP